MENKKVENDIIHHIKLIDCDKRHRNVLNENYLVSTKCSGIFKTKFTEKEKVEMEND